MRSVSFLGSFLIFCAWSAVTSFASVSSLTSNCGASDDELPLPAFVFGESLKADDAAGDMPDLSLLQVRAGPARKFPGIGALARGIQSATSQVFGRRGGTVKIAGICGFSEAVTAAEVPGGKVRSYDGEITAEGCLHWCLGETMCRSAVFEPDSSSCHVLPEFYGKDSKRMLVTGSGAVAADKTCETKCKFSKPKKGKSPGAELKTLTAGTLGQCQDHCLKEKECFSLVFKAEDGICFLKSEVADPDAEYAADDAEFCNKECHEKCSFKDPVMLESFEGSAPLEHRKGIAELATCQKGCEECSDCHAVLFGPDTADCFLLPLDDDDDDDDDDDATFQYFSTGDAVISKKKACDDHKEFTLVTNSSDSEKPDDYAETMAEDEKDVDEAKMAVLPGNSGSEIFDVAAEFEHFENGEDADDNLVEILPGADSASDQDNANKHTIISGDDDVDKVSVDVASEFGDRSDDVAKIMADFHVDADDEVDVTSEATTTDVSDDVPKKIAKDISDRKVRHKKGKKGKAISSGDAGEDGNSKLGNEMAELEDDGQEDYSDVFDVLKEDDNKPRQVKPEHSLKTADSKPKAPKAMKQGKVKDEEDKNFMVSARKSDEKLADSDAGGDAHDDEEDFTDNDEDLADVFEHLDDKHDSTLVKTEAHSQQPTKSGSIDLKKLKHDESAFAKDHNVPEHKADSVEDARSEVRKARKAEKARKAHKSHRSSNNTGHDETADLVSGSGRSFSAGSAPTLGPLTLNSASDSASITNQSVVSSVAQDSMSDPSFSEGTTQSADLDPTLEAQKAALQAVLQGKTRQAQEAQQVQQVVSQPQVPLPGMAQLPAIVPPQVPQQTPQQPPQHAPQQAPQQQNVPRPQVQPQEQPQQPLQSSQLMGQQSEQQQAPDDEDDKPYDLSWLSDAGVDVPNQVSARPPQQQFVPQPQQPATPQQSLLTAQPQAAVAQEAPPAALATERSIVVHIDGPDGPSVLLGGHVFDGVPAAAGVGDVPSVMDLSLQEGSGFSVAFTIDWQEFSPGVHAIDISDKDSHSDILSVSSAEDGSALSFAMTRDGTPSVLTVPNAFEVGTSARYLCTVGPTGKMQAFRDGTILGRLKPDGSYQDDTRGGRTNPAVANGQLSLGRSTEGQHSRGSTFFAGWLGDICVFPKEVLWGDAASCVEKANAASA